MKAYIVCRKEFCLTLVSQSISGSKTVTRPLPPPSPMSPTESVNIFPVSNVPSKSFFAVCPSVNGVAFVCSVVVFVVGNVFVHVFVM